MKIEYPSHVIVFYIFHNIHAMIHICGEITFRKICLKLKNIFGTNQFMVCAYKKIRV